MNPVTTTHLNTTLIFDYGGAESNLRMSNLHPDASADNLRAFGRAVNTLQRVVAHTLIKETRTQLS